MKFRKLANGKREREREKKKRKKKHTCAPTHTHTHKHTRHCHWNSEQLTFMSPFLEPYNYYTQMSMYVKYGLPLWGQDYTTMC